MIMIGGLLYLTAGGSPERVGNAKSYIGNALIGLVLLLTSYVVLQTINPQLVQFSRFTIPLIRPARLPARFCNEFPAPLPTQPPLKFARATVGGTSEIKPLAEIRDADYNITDASEMRCGATYYEQASGDETCLGKSCRYTSAPGAGHPGACVPTTDDEKTWDCMNVAFAGTLKSNTPIKDIVLIRTGIDCGLTSFCSCVYDVDEKIWPDFYYVSRMPITPCDLRAGFALSFGDDPSILESFFRVVTFSGFNPWRVASADRCTNGQNSAVNDQYTGSGNLYFNPFVLTDNDTNFHGPAICNVDTDLLPPPSR
jgi:hypothetical protein